MSENLHAICGSRQPATIRRFIGMWLVICIALCSSYVPCAAQDLRFEYLGVEDGLSHPGVFSIIQDNQGFMWFGTAEGLNRYDGYTFKTYKKDIADSTSISGNWITSLLEDHTGKIWVGASDGGVSMFDPQTERFTRLMHEPDDPYSLSDNSGNVVFEDREETIWVGTYGGLNRFDPSTGSGQVRETGRFTRFQIDSLNAKSISSNWITSIYQDRQGTLWIGTEAGGLNRYDPVKNEFRRYVHDPDDPTSLSGNTVRAVVEDKEGNLWISVAYAGLSRLDKARERFTHFQHDATDPQSLSDNDGRALYVDRSGRLWFGSWRDGLNIFDASTGKFQRYTNDPEDPWSLSTPEIITIYEDRSGVVWVGTSQGVNKFDPGAKPFHSFVNESVPGNNQSPGNRIWAIHLDRSRALWMGTTDGLFRRTDDGQIQSLHFRHDPNDPASLSDNEVFSLHEGRDGTFWIGTGNGLDALTPSSLSTIDINSDVQFVHWLQTDENLSGIRNNQVFSIVEDQDSVDVLWVATARGLIRFNPGKPGQDRTTIYEKEPENPHGLKSSQIRTLLFDRSGILWMGSIDEGLFAFDRQTERFTWYSNDPDKPGSISNNSIRSLYEDRAGILWIGTDFGLNRFDPTLDRFEAFTVRDGLPNDVIYGILPDAQDRLWLSTNDGLSLFDPAQGSFRNFTTGDGIRHAAFNRGAYFRSETGEMFFGSMEGMTVFHPDSIRQNTSVPPVVISSLQRYTVEDGDGHFIEERGISRKSALDLSYRNILLTFEFAALNFQNAPENQYAYQLEGYHDEWIQLGNERRVTFTNLDPGTYTLRVKGSNNDGVWNEAGTSLLLTIASPPWETWWAYSLYALIAVALLFAARRYELSRINLKNRLAFQSAEAENLRQLDEMKSRFFANISHEFRTPLTLILGPAQQLLKKSDDESDRRSLGTIQRNASRLLQLINQVLDLAKFDAGKMNIRVERSDFIPFIRGLVMSFESLAHMRDIRLEFVCDHASLPLYFDPEKLSQVFNNLLSNAFKFTSEGGTVSVSVGLHTPSVGSDRTKGYVEIAVRDTGEGIPAGLLPRIFDRFYQVEDSSVRRHEGTGIGLTLVKELIELHRGEITVASEIGKGSTFTVLLRLGKDHFEPKDIFPGTESAGVVPQEKIVQPDPSTPLAIHDTSEAVESDADDRPLVLVIEDNADVRSFIRLNLESDHQVVEAACGAAGIEKAREIIPDLVISDLMMPEMDGYEVCKSLKTDERTSHIPVILLTARAELKDKIEGLETGADDYLTKPFEVDELRARIKNLIELRRKLLERLGKDAVLKPGEIAVTSVDQSFLERVVETVEANIDREDFSLEDLCEAVAMSERQLRRKVKALTNQAPNEFIRSFRLQRARQLIEQNAGTVTEIGYMVGFSNPSYFAKSFRDHFGKPPSEFVTHR